MTRLETALFSFAVGAGLAACSPAKPAVTEPGETSWPAASAADALFPLVQGRIYHYVTNDNGEHGMLVAKVSRNDATHGSLRIGATEKRFMFDAKGVAYEGGAYVLQIPLAVGTEWPGEHGGTTRISAVDVTVSVPAGSYGSCLETVEEVVPEARYSNVYCPGIGLVTVDVTAPRGHARIELQRYGKPVEI